MNSGVQFNRIHHGTNLRRFREAKGLKQNVIAEMLKMSQQSVSRYESLPIIEDEILSRFSLALKIPIEMIKNLNDDLASYVVESIKNNTPTPMLDLNTLNIEKLEKIIVEKEREKEMLIKSLLKSERKRNNELKKILYTLKEMKQEISFIKTYVK